MAKNLASKSAFAVLASAAGIVAGAKSSGSTCAKVPTHFGGFDKDFQSVLVYESETTGKPKWYTKRSAENATFVSKCIAGTLGLDVEGALKPMAGSHVAFLEAPFLLAPVVEQALTILQSSGHAEAVEPYLNQIAEANAEADDEAND